MIPLIDQKATGLRLKELMEKNGYTVSDLRKYLSLACPQSVYHWFSGKSLPSLENFYALGELFHVSIDEMLVGNRKTSCQIHRSSKDRIQFYFSRLFALAIVCSE